MSDNERRCEHLACLCNVSGADATCSAHCASPDAHEAHDTICRCGHPACAKVTEEQLHGHAGRESA